ncbi:hypothetical protein MJG53_013282 [Ovis ammon polii x Ovis aries]|uniref:Uncharacterized protein n=1 Tax=Ovis ammon polii x Ovis aries TaxID=2918886 RepID=A0ACB9UI41_9CETA|nr:hypothetical protein MJG53_013282 [Ovis ammon polii x Ovis aries]
MNRTGFRVTSTTLGPWANSTIHLTKPPETGTSLLCEGRNPEGTHALTILLKSDLTQKPELHVPGTLAAGGPATLACSFRGACKETKALFISWKGPNVSACTDGSSNSSSPYPSSLVLHFTLKPKDRCPTLRCHLNFCLAHLPGSSMVRLQVACECWWMRDDSEPGRDADPRERHVSWAGGQEWSGEQSHLPLDSGAVRPEVTSNIAAPWANSTISLLGEPEIVTGLHCEGRNQHGIHTSSIFLIPPDKNSVSNALVKGLIQGVVYGSIATALFFFFLVLLAMKMLKWWEESHIPKASEALIPEKPEMLEEPKIPQESAAEPSPASVAAEVPFQQLSPSGPQMVMTLEGASPAPDPWRRQAHPLAATTLPGKDSKI